MLIAEDDISLDSTNQSNAVLDVEDIPLFIASGSLNGTGDITLKQYYDTPGVFYAPTGTISMTGSDNDVFGCMIGKSISINDDCAIWGTDQSVLFPNDIRNRASDLPGRVSGEEGIDVYGWKSQG